MMSLGQAPVTACSAVFLPAGYSGSVNCDPTYGGINYLSAPATEGEPDTEPLLVCSSFSVPSDFQGSIPCDSNGGAVGIALPEVTATATVVDESGDVTGTTAGTSTSSSSLGLLALVAFGIYLVSGGGGQ